MAPIFLPLDYDHPQQSKRLGQSSHCNIQLAQQGWPNERRTCKSLGRSVFPKNNTPTNDQSADFAGFRPNDLILLYQSLASCKTLIDMANHGKISFQSGIYIPNFSFSQGSMGGVFGSQFWDNPTGTTSWSSWLWGMHCWSTRQWIFLEKEKRDIYLDKWHQMTTIHQMSCFFRTSAIISMIVGFLLRGNVQETPIFNGKNHGFL